VLRKVVDWVYPVDNNVHIWTILNA